MIERGIVLAVGEEHNLTITKDYTVLVHNVPAGTLRDNLTWFPETPKPRVEDIEEIVFLEAYVWGVKQFKSRLEEFNALSKDAQENILDRVK